MDTKQFTSILDEIIDNSQTIHGIFHWCDQWCERCSQTKHCTLYQTSTHLPSEKPEDFFKSLSMIFEITLDMLKEYGKQVKHWFLSLKTKEPFAMEIRMQDPMLSDCMEVIQWYQYLLEVKLARALMSQKDEEEEHSNSYDSLGNAKLLLVSIQRNMGAWGYFYEKFKEDEDEILDILICLQKLRKKIEQLFPEAWTFIRPGLD
jgi:hypothetical protein